MSRPFTRHWERKLAARPSHRERGATINGKPAWQVVEERRKAATIASAKGQAS